MTKDESVEHVNRLRDACSLAPISGPAAELNITASFGLSFIGESELLNTFTVEILEHAIQIADHRLSHAKQEGRNRVCSAG
ncbi:MAG: hypothetical protein ACLR7Z_09130 [Bilophila wadsworthia]